MQTIPAKSSRNATPATVRVAMWSARHRWLVVGLWFLFVIGVFGTGSLIGTQTEGVNGGSSGANTESTKAWEVFDTGGAPPPADSLVLVVSNPTVKVSDPQYQNVLAKTTEGLNKISYTSAGQTQNVITDLKAPVGLAALALLSKDQTSARFVGTIGGTDREVQPKMIPVQAFVKDLRSQNPGYQFYVFTNSSINDDFDKILQSDLRGSLVITLPLTFLILLIAFGTVAAALIPLILALTALLSAFGLLAIYSHLIATVDSSATEVVVLIGLAVGIDYSLFMLTRYRTERRHGRAKMTAIEIASSTAGRSVFFSGLIVMISLAGLFLVNESIFTSIAAGTIGVVLVSVIGSLTFLPAVMAILGNGVNWGRLPYFGRDREEGSGFWAWLVSLVMRRPAVFVVTSLVLLLGLAFPLLHLRLGSNGLDGLPDSIEGVKAIRLMNEKWPDGTILKLNVIVTQADQPATKAALDKFSEAALQLKGLGVGDKPVYSTDGKVVNLTYVMAGSRNDQSNQEIVQKLRREVVPTYLKSLPGVQAYVAGGAAATYDVVNRYINSIPLVFGFVLGLSFLLLLVAFHSLIIPIKAIILNLFSSGAAYGIMVLVFQDGYLSQQIGFRPTGVIESFAPLFLFTILFGLSMDYHLFILTRIKEARDKGASSNEAVAKGISVTSGTITSAAAIMVVVFSVFVTLQIIIVRQLGLGLAVAVFIDATVIRSILLPATMRLLGDWNWWLPKFLDWLPQITIESEIEDEEETPAELVQASQTLN